MTYRKQGIIKYPEWLKKNCPVCNNIWLEIWAFVWSENDKDHSSPVGICPKCDYFTNLKDFDFKGYKEHR